METQKVKLIQLLNKFSFNIFIGLISPLYQSQAMAQEPISLSWALQQTIAKNPILQSYPYELRIVESAQVQASITPAPTINIELENAFGNGQFTGLSESETTLTLGQTIELGNKRQSRINTATAHITKLQAEYELKRLEVLAETSRRYYDVLRLKALQQNQQHYIEQEQKSVASVKRLANAGSVGQADVSKLSLELSRSIGANKRLLTEVSLAKNRLAAMWLLAGDFETPQDNIKQLPAIPGQGKITEAIQLTPTYLLSQSQIELAQRQLQLEKANGQNDIDVGLGIRHIAASDDQAFVLNFSMPLTRSNPNRGNIAAAQARYQQNQQRLELTRSTLSLTLSEIHQRLLLDRDQIELIEKQLLPQAKQLMTDTARGYHHGEYSVLQWFDAKKTLFDLEKDLINGYSKLYFSLLELERLTGQNLSNNQL